MPVFGTDGPGRRYGIPDRRRRNLGCSVGFLPRIRKLETLEPGGTEYLTALKQNKWPDEILGRFEEIALPGSWLVAGCIAQTIWNLRCGQPAEFGIKDVESHLFRRTGFISRSRGWS